MKLMREEEGQTLVLTALLMCCLMGFMALALDVGVAYRQQRRLQVAADAAAIAAGWSYYNSGNLSTSSCGSTTGNILCAAQNGAAQNGVTDTTQINAHVSPTYGQHTGAAYVEVIIQQPATAMFMGTFAGLFPGGTTNNYNGLTVGARAVVGIVSDLSCDHQLDPSNSGALTLQGGARVTAPNCVMQVNSDSPSAVCFTGSKAVNAFNVLGVQVAGGQNKGPGCSQIDPGAQTGVGSSPDPFGNITGFFPDPSVCGSTVVSDPTPTLSEITAATVKNVSTGGFQPTSPTATPNTYSVVCFNAGAGVPTTLSNITIGDAASNTLFLFEQGVVISGGVNINGTLDLNNGMFCQGSYNTSSKKCSFSGSNTLTITSPADVLNGAQYAFNGMAIIVPGSNNVPTCDSSYQGITPTATGTPDACVQVQFGSGSGNLDGMLYMPKAVLYLQDNGAGTCSISGTLAGTPAPGTLVTSLITADLYDKSSDICISNYSLNHVDSPLTHVSLVE